MNLREKIGTSFQSALEVTGSELTTELNDNTLLLESGLDSLGFAVLVALLEEELSYDPFGMMENAVYPKTYGEFIAIYERYKDNAK